MSLTMLALFVPACFAINMAPGPNNLLSISNASRHGVLASCIGGIGRLVAFAAMIAVASVGLAVALYASALIFTVVKVVGALYLFVLAVQLWRSSEVGYEVDGGPKRSVAALMRREFMVAGGNPKAILVFTAFLPQFVDASAPPTPQFLLLGACFLLLEAVAIVIYSSAGGYLRRWFRDIRARRLFNRTCGTLLGCAGVGLLLTRRSA